MDYLDSREDLQWLRETHCPDLPEQATAVVLHGNEDCPEAADVYVTNPPLYTDVPVRYSRGEDGLLHAA